MMNQALFDVVKNQLAGGVSEEEIREFLHRRGVGEDEIRELFSSLAPDAPALADIPVVEAEREVVADVLAASVAHGVERDVPPLHPSAPFVAETPTPQQMPAAEPIVAAQPSAVPASGIILPPMPNKKRRFAVIALAVVALLALIAGGAYAYYAYFASPEQVMDRMFSNLRDVRSVAFSNEFIVTTSSALAMTGTSTAGNPIADLFAAQQGPTTFTIKLSGVVDALVAERPSMAATIEASMDKWQFGDLKIGVDYRNLDRKNYLRVNEVPNLGFFKLDFVKDKWFVIEDKEAKAQLGASSGSSDAVVPTVSDEQREQIYAAWKEHRFLTVSETLPSEDVDGVSTHHYRLALDKEAFKAWIITTDAVMQRPERDDRALDDSLAALDIETFELWIGKRDGLPHKIFLRGAMRDANDLNSTSAMTVTFLAKDYNKPADIAVPEDARPFEEAIQGVFAQMIEGVSVPVSATPEDRNVQRQSNVAAIANAIKQNIADNGGTFLCAAGPLPQKATFLGAPGFGATWYPIEPCLVPTYLSTMLKDPTKGSVGNSGYSAFYDPKTKRITVRAPYAEGGVKISITK